MSLKEQDLKSEILAMLHRYAEVICDKFIAVENEINCGDTSAENELREINAKLNKNGNMLKSLYESMVDGIITKDEFVQMKSDYETKIADLSERADEIRNNHRETENKKIKYSDFADAVSAVLANDMLTADIIENLIDKIFVNPDKSFEINFKFSDIFGGVV